MSSAIHLQNQINLNYYLNLVSFTLLYYDYFLTLDAEVDRYWWNGLSWPTFLFFLNRYLTLFGTIPVAFQYFWTAESTPQKLQVCKTLHSYHEYFAVVTQIIIGVMLILRTYALYERNKRILILMVLIAFAVIAVGLWAVLAGPSSGSDETIPALNLYIGCSSSVTTSQARGLAAAWGGMTAFDCSIFLLTLYRGLSRRHSTSSNILAILLRDGSIYFGVIVLASLANILTFVLAAPYTRGMPTTFTNVLSSIMISRLMLNLRDPTLISTGRFAGSTMDTSTDRGAVFSTYMLRGGTSAPGALTQMQSQWDMMSEPGYGGYDIELRDRV